MAVTLNLLQLLSSDDQSTFTDKCNFNFDQILAMGGGPPGAQGITGIQGVPGAQGVQGFQGDPGTPGSRWYVEPTDPISFGPITPTPNEGDFWFDTASLVVYQYAGSPPSWSVIGTLTVSGLFKDAPGDNDRVIFSTPTPLKSLVLSPINYGLGAPQPGPYKLKLIGSPGGPMMNFGVLETGAENLAAKQSYIVVNTVSVGSEYSWEVVNPTGNIHLSAFGTSLVLNKQVSGVSVYSFNGNELKVQINPTDRLMSFYTSPVGLGYHIGGHAALTSTSQRLFSVMDGGQVGVGDPFSNIVTGDTAATDYKFDVNNGQLSGAVGGSVKWARFRGKVSSTAYDYISFRHVRNFTDNQFRSSEVRIEHRQDNQNRHFAAFGGGAPAGGFLSINRPTFRLGIGGTANDGYYFGANEAGQTYFGTSQFIKDQTGLFGGLFLPKAQVNVQSLNTTGNLAAHSSIHLWQPNSPVVGSVTGITAGINTIPYAVIGGVQFQNVTTATVGSGSNTGSAIHFGSGDGVVGWRTAETIYPNGEHFFWSRTNGNHWMNIATGGQTSGSNIYANDITQINSYDWASNNFRSLVILPGESTSGGGDGFVGIGGQFSEVINAGANLTIGKLYKAVWGTGPVNVLLDPTPYPDAVPFTAISPNLLNGQVVLAKPQTKFHVFGAVTFGTRQNITNYTTDVGTLSFTHGNNHRASGNRSVILSGSGNTVSGADTVLIGGTNINTAMSNRVLLGSTTHISTTAPTSYINLPIYTNGPVAGTYYHNLTSNPILHVASAVTVPAFGIFGEVYGLARTMILEAKHSSSTFGTGGPSMEFHVRNSANQLKQHGSIFSTLAVTTATTENGNIHFAVYNNPNTGSGSGAQYEVAKFTPQGLALLPGAFGKSQIFVDPEQESGVAGGTLQISAGAGGPGTSTGGSLYLQPGPGFGGGADGDIYLGGVLFGTNGFFIRAFETIIGHAGGGANNLRLSANGGEIEMYAQVRGKVGTGSDELRLAGKMQAVQNTFSNPGPTASAFVGYSNTIGGGGNTTTSTATQTASGDTLNVTMSRTFTGTMSGTTTINGGTQLWHLTIAPVNYDRTIVMTGGGNAGGTGIIELRLGGTGGTMYRRHHGDVYNGMEFLIPANATVAVRYEATNPGYGTPGFAQSGTNSFTWTFREFKHGLA